MRAQKSRIRTETTACGMTPSPGNSRAWECGAHVAFLLPTAAASDALAEKTDGSVALKTGRYVYTEWDPVLEHRGAHHAAVNPFAPVQNRGCRMGYSKEMCRQSLDILGRTVCLTTHPDFSDDEVARIIERITTAGAVPS